MSVGMLLTGLVAWAVGTNEQMMQTIFKMCIRDRPSIWVGSDLPF